MKSWVIRVLLFVLKSMTLGLLLVLTAVFMVLQFLISLVFRSRVFDEAFEAIKTGMTENQVELLFGAPGNACTPGDDHFGPPLSASGLTMDDLTRIQGRYWNGSQQTFVVRFLGGSVVDKGCLPGNPQLDAIVAWISRMLPLHRLFGPQSGSLIEDGDLLIKLYHDSHFTFRFADDRFIPRFHLDGVEPGRKVSVFQIDPVSGERLGLLAECAVGAEGWLYLPQPIIVRAGEAFIAVPQDAAYRDGAG